MGKARAIVASYIGVLVYASLVFLAAGRLAYWQGLLYVAVALIGTTLNHVLVPAGSAITEERARGAAAGQLWDRRVLGAFFAVNVAMFVTAGLDSGRFGWSGPVPLSITVAGVVLMLLGQLVFAMAKRENRFFSSTVQIQVARGHRVCDTGPYRLVRHPGYLGMLMSLPAFPLVMNSWWAFVPALAAATLLLVRTLLEDRYLMSDLPGYRDYASATRWRLAPGLF